MSIPFVGHRTKTGSQLSRRSLLQGTVAVGVLAAAAGLSAPLSVLAADSKPDFMRLSEFLTGRPLDPVLGGRYYAALAKRHPQLSAEIAALLGAIDSSKVANMDAFLALPATDKALTATASTIVSAWYLGIVGEAADAELISYSDALMYQPSRGILIVPTYGIGPNAWGEKPAMKL